MNSTSIDRVDFFFKPQIDELVYLFHNGIEIMQKNTKIILEFMGCDLKQKKLSNLTPKWNQDQGCDHCTKTKQVHDRVSCWPGRNGPPRTNTTQTQAQNGISVSQFQILPYYCVKYFFPPDIMHHVFCDGLATKTMQSTTSTIEKEYFDNSKHFQEYCNSLKVYIPSDDGRNLRLLPSKDFHKYKAAEIRNLLKTAFLPIFENMIEGETKKFLWDLRKFCVAAENDSSNSEDLKKMGTELVQELQDCFGERHVTLKSHELKHLHDFKREFGSLKLFWGFHLENFLSFLKKMLHSTQFVDEEFMLAGNYQFFTPLLQEKFQVDVDAIFGSNQHEMIQVDGFYVNKEIEPKKWNSEQKKSILSLLKFLHPQKTYKYFPKSLKIFQYTKALESEQKIAISTANYKGKRRDHFVKKKNESIFGIVELICYFENKINIGVQILEKFKNMYPNNDYPYLKKEISQRSLAFYEPCELQTIGYLECEVGNVACFAPLFD